MSRTHTQNCLFEVMGLQILQYFLTRGILIIRVAIFVPTTLEFIGRPYLCQLAKLEGDGYVLQCTELYRPREDRFYAAVLRYANFR